jgi:hypothetical protein
MHPRIVSDASGNPLIIWGRMSDESVFFSRWDGNSFTIPLQLNSTWLPVATASWMGPDIASKGDTVYVVMKQTPEDINPIYIISSFDGGINFSAPIQVDFIEDSNSRFPTVTIDDTGNPIVGFMKFDPGFVNARWVVTKSNDYGSTFTSDVLASGWSGAGATVCDCCPGSITSLGNTVAMLYRDNLSNIRDSWAGISFNGGNSFTQGLPIDQNNWMLMMCPSSGPDGVIIGDTLYSTFMNGASGTSMTYFSKSSLTSLTGAPGELLTGIFPGLTYQNYPRIASDGGSIAIVWKQEVNEIDELAVSLTSDLEIGFPASYEIVDLDDVTNTDVAINNGNIFVVWEDDNSGTVKFRSGSFSISTSVDIINKRNFSVFPNPVIDLVNIAIDGAEQSKSLKVSIHDVIGRNLKDINVLPNDSVITIPVANLSAGIYFIKISDEDNVYSIKFIKH